MRSINKDQLCKIPRAKSWKINYQKTILHKKYHKS